VSLLYQVFVFVSLLYQVFVFVSLLYQVLNPRGDVTKIFVHNLPLETTIFLGLYFFLPIISVQSVSNSKVKFFC